MLVSEFIEKNCDIVKSDIPGDEENSIYVSKYDGSYITRVGMEHDIERLFLKFGIIEQIQSINGGRVACIGFNPVEKKWYGWSHRAIYGFGIGSSVKEGSCAYRPDSKENFIKDCNNFWKDDDYKGSVQSVEFQNEQGVLGVQTTWEYNNEIPNEKMRGQINGVFTQYPEEWGKGEWTAETLEDAKQMAKDFAEGVG